MKAVVFLQNAWSSLYAGGTWPRDSWLRALARSRTGQRLRVLEAAARDVEFWYDNTTPVVGASPDSVLPPDLPHVVAVIRSQAPDVVVALGKQAERVLREVDFVPRLVLPHPAHRVVTNALFRDAGLRLARGVKGIVTLSQRKSGVEVAVAVNPKGVPLASVRRQTADPRRGHDRVQPARGPRRREDQ